MMLTAKFNCKKKLLKREESLEEGETRAGRLGAILVLSWHWAALWARIISENGI